MKIAFDCRALSSVRTGGGRYTENLLNSLLEIDEENDYLLCAHRPFCFEGKQNARKFEGSFFPGLLWQNLSLPAVLAMEKADLLHSPLFTLPYLSACPGLVTVFDLTPVILPELHTGKVRFSFFPVGNSLRKAEKIIAISENTKKDIVSRMGIPEGKISVIYPGVEQSFKPAGPEEKKRVKKKYASGKDYMLHVGTLEPRKNLEFLIDVFRELISAGADMGVNLLLAGPRGWKYGGIFDRILSYGLSGRVLTAGYVDQADLPALYSGAEVFVYPSLYEGFGLPLLEAMACGLPAVSAAGSSLPEVIGDAGIQVKGWSAKEWAAVIGLLLRDESTRDEFAMKGKIRARDFNWRVCAEKTLEIYRFFE